MESYTVTLLLAWLLAMVGTPLVMRVATRQGWVDRPTERKLHDHPIPYMGGVAVFGAAILSVALILPWSPEIQEVAFGRGSLSALACGLVAVVALGIYDDLYDIPAFVKASLQFVIAAATWLLGFQCGDIELPFGGWVLLGTPVLSFLTTVFWIVIVTNAFNLIDGLDGLSAGIGIAAALTLVVLGQGYGASVAVIASLALAGALAAFLRFNLPPARIFLGDAGAMGIGYTTAVVSLASYQKAPTALVLVLPLVVLGLPLVDTILAILRRTTNHLRRRGTEGLRPLELARAITSADRGHIHYVLLRSGLTIRGVLFSLYALSAALGFIALWARTATPGVRWGVFLGLILAGMVALYLLESRLGRVEAREEPPAGAEPEQRRAAG